MERLAVALLTLYAFAVPWEYALDLGEPFGNVARLVAISLLLTVIPVVLARGGLRRPGAAQWLVLAFYAYFACTYFWTVDADATAEKMRAYFQVMMIVWLAWEVAYAPSHLRGMLRAFVLGCWVLAVLTLLNFSSASAVAGQIAGQARFVAEGQDPNDVARFLDLGFPLAALLFAVERRWLPRLTALGYFPAGLLAVLLTASRGGFSGAIVALAGSLLVWCLWRPWIGGTIFAGLGATVGGLWLIVPVETLQRLATIPEQVGGGDLNDRLQIWEAGWHAFARAPLFGYGAGTFTWAAGLAEGDTAHNTVMAVVVTGGLVALAILAAILATVMARIARTRGLLRWALGTVFAVWLVTSMVGSVEENRATWLIFAAIALAGRLENEQSEAMAAIFSGKEAAGSTATPAANSYAGT